ncbi:MAG: hypothetical protein ACJ790_21875 [Myxococcaceae bacterium]
MKNEGVTTTIIEDQTRRIPSLTFLGLAVGSMGVSLALMAAGKKHWAMFVGQWVPTILICGVYNKIAKTFSAPLNEEERLRHGDHRILKPNDFTAQQHVQ